MLTGTHTRPVRRRQVLKPSRSGSMTSSTRVEAGRAHERKPIEAAAGDVHVEAGSAEDWPPRSASSC